MISDKLSYIVDGPLLKHFYLLNNTLHCKTINYNKETKNEIIHKEIIYYVINKDVNDVIHIMVVDTFGRLIHIFNNDKQWKKRKIENTNLGSYVVKDLKLYIDPKDFYNVNFLLILSPIKDINLWSIKQYSIRKNSWSSEKIHNFFAEEYEATIETDVDNKGNIHLVYKSKNSNYYTLLYRMYSIETKKWNYPEKLSSNSMISNINILCNSNDYVNVVWSELKNKNIVIYNSKKKVSSSNPYGWKKSKSLSTNSSNVTNLILIEYDNYLSLVWIQNNKFYFTKTKIHEDNWTNVKIIDEINHLELTPICYIGNSYKKYKSVKIPFTYYLSNKKDLYLIGLDTNTPDTRTHNSNETMESSDSKFDEYMKSVDINFENKMKNSNDFTKHYDLDMHKFTGKLVDLYYEIEDLKNKELMLYNSLFKIRSEHLSLYEKIEDILKDYEKLK